MAINWAAQVYLPIYNTFARPITVTPLASQPNVNAYDARGIYNTEPIDVAAEDGTIVSEARSIIDILETEFSVQPLQGDQIAIPADSGMPAVGTFFVIETKSNGGGETTLVLRRSVVAKP